MRNPIDSLRITNRREGNGRRFGAEPPKDRRREFRSAADSPAVITLLDSKHPTAARIPARVVSASASGLQLRLGFILPCSPVEILLADKTVSARVRYCVSSGNEFSVGVRMARALREFSPSPRLGSA